MRSSLRKRILVTGGAGFLGSHLCELLQDGLAPNPYQSGNAIHTRLSKVGDALLRKVLFMPALVAWKHNPIIRAFCERLKANGKSGKAVACAAMRKLLHIAFGVIHSGKPFDPHYALAK